MIDSVLKGTGNSRFLKSAVPAGTSWADALAMLQAGTFPIDFNGINAEGFQQVGTPLNKANLLKDATAAQIGLPPSTTPDGMFQALGNTGELHVWRKTVVTSQEIPAGYNLGSVQTGAFTLVSSNYITYEYGTPTISDDGTVGLSVVGTMNVNYQSNLNDLKGKFCRTTASGGTSFPDGQVIFIPGDAVFSIVGVTKETNKYQPVTGYAKIPAGTTTTYPVSTNPNAFQEGDDAKEAGYVVGEVVTGKVLASKCYNNTAIYYGKSVSVSDDGIVSILNPTTRTLSSTLSSAEIAAIKESFVYFSGNENYSDVSSAFRYGNIVYIPADASVSTEYANSAYGVYIDRYQPVTGYAAIPAGTTIEYLGKLGDKARVQVVSYVGTGTYGSKNDPITLTFPFAPKYARYIYNFEYGEIPLTSLKSDSYINAVWGSTTSGRPVSTKISENGKTLSWYGNYGADYASNYKGTKYHILIVD